MNTKKIGFIGLGLIGGSIAKTLKRIKPEIELIATAGHESTILEAYEDHTISNSCLLSPEDFSDCDYIFLCTPVKINVSYLKGLKNHIKGSCIITDVGSVKGDIHREVSLLGMEDYFIGGHPMTGSEKTGYTNATSYLLENAYYIITPTSSISTEKVDEFYDFVKDLGALPLILDYNTHDYATASISHLPHIISASLVNLVQNCDTDDETMKRIAAGGFKDITRISSSSPVMWENICLSNRVQILRLMDMYLDVFKEMRDKIDKADGPAINDFFHSAKNYRDSLTLQTSDGPATVFELYCDLADEEGGIATITTKLANNHISIKNIGIIHNREYELGVLHMEFYTLSALENASDILKAAGYTIYLR